MNLKNSKFLWKSFLSIFQELFFLSPTWAKNCHTSGWAWDAQGYSEGIARGIKVVPTRPPPTCPRPRWAQSPGL